MGNGRGRKELEGESGAAPWEVIRSIQLDTKLFNGFIDDLQKHLQVFEVKSF